MIQTKYCGCVAAILYSYSVRLVNLSLELASSLGILPRFSNFHSRYYMSALLISLLTLVLILISAFVVLLVLMQRTSQSGGMGAALGGGAAESAFGSDTNNILTKGTIYGIIAFFMVALGLFLLYQSAAADKLKVVNAGDLISAEVVVEETVPVATDEIATAVEEIVAEVKVVDGVVEAAVESDVPALEVNAEAVPISN